MNKHILITGMPGSGKSAITKELTDLGSKAFDIEAIEGLFTMVDINTGKAIKDFDVDNLEMVKRAKWVCDKKKLQRLMHQNPIGIVFYCGAVGGSNFDDLQPLFDKVILLEASQNTLLERLTTRSSNTFARTPKTQKWLLDRKKWWEGHLIEKGSIAINANRPVREIAENIIEIGKSC